MRHRYSFFCVLLVGLGLLFTGVVPARAFIGVSINVGIAPPPLRVYDQPEIPAAGYIWTPGYWAWNPDIQDYYWVPGTWILAPRVGYLWTPPWWGWNDGVYVFHTGYWGPHVGFYGGIAYGYGYTGYGYEGGYWNGGHFFYNRTVNHVTNVTNVYSKTVTVNRTTNVSYNGGAGGVAASPTAEQLQAAHETHLAPTAAQARHLKAASKNPSFRHGHPVKEAANKPGALEKSPSTASAHGTRPKTKSRPESHPAALSEHRAKKTEREHPSNNEPKSPRPKTEAKASHHAAPAARQHRTAPHPAKASSKSSRKKNQQ